MNTSFGVSVPIRRSKTVECRNKKQVLPLAGLGRALALITVCSLFGLPSYVLAVTQTNGEPDYVISGRHKFHPSHLLARVVSDDFVNQAEEAVAKSGFKIKRKYRLVRNLWLIETRNDEVSFGSMTDYAKLRRLRQKADELIQSRLFQYFPFIF